MKLSESDWHRYVRASDSSDIPSFRSFGLPVGNVGRRNFMGTVGTDDGAQKVNNLISIFDREFKEERHELTDERKLLEVSRLLFDKIDMCDLEACAEIMDAGFPINYQKPHNQETILHHVTRQALLLPEDWIKELLKLFLSYSPDLLIKDNLGKLPLHNTVFFKVPQPYAEEIAQLTRQAAIEAGVNLAEDFKQYYATWMEKGIVGLKAYLDNRVEELMKTNEGWGHEPE